MAVSSLALRVLIEAYLFMTFTKSLTDQRALLECFHLKDWMLPHTPLSGQALIIPVSNKVQCTLTSHAVIQQRDNAVGWIHDG